MTEVVLPDGTRIHGRGRRQPWAAPEFGLYLCRLGGWQPAWPSDRIDWPDFRVPRAPERAAADIVHAYELARSGTRVEIVCGGGTGRTGTVVACMAVLAGHPVDDAVGWTRRNYRARAVETPGQRRWVQWFADRQV